MKAKAGTTSGFYFRFFRQVGIYQIQLTGYQPDNPAYFNIQYPAGFHIGKAKYLAGYPVKYYFVRRLKELTVLKLV